MWSRTIMNYGKPNDEVLKLDGWIGNCYYSFYGTPKRQAGGGFVIYAIADKK